MANLTKKPNTIKSIGKKVADNGNASDYVYVPIGADSDNVDRPDGSTVEESLSNIEVEKVEIIPIEILPTVNIKEYPFIYALVKANETKGILYEYRDGEWIPYGNGSNGIWVGTKEECAKDFNNIENGTFVIIINKNEGTGETHTHDYVCFVTKEPTYSQTGTKTCTCFLCGESYTEEIPALVDSINPAGVIRIGTNEYATWKDVVEFNKYYNENQTVTIEATDNETGIKEIAYYLATAAINTSDIGSINWTVYNDAFEIAPNNNYIIYARITDNADNVTYICSDGIVMDNIPPVFEGLEDGGTYPTGTVLTVEEGATLTVNNNVVDLVNNTYTFTEAMDNCILSLTDKAGNSTSISVNIEIKIIAEAPIGAHLNWQYTLNDEDGTIILNQYIGSETDVIVYGNYDLDDKIYNTVINNASMMFIRKSNIKTITFNCNINTINLTNTSRMFMECDNLCQVSFGDNFNTNKIVSMFSMFSGCESLISLDLSAFDTSSVKDMQSMFSDCKSLTELDLSSFDTSNVVTMNNMFSGCKKLTNLVINSFNTSKVTTMSSMFSGCESLTELDLSSFDTSNVSDMYYMFNFCQCLTNLDLQTFDTSKVTKMQYMFYACFELKYIYVANNKWIIMETCDTLNMFDACGVLSVTYI